MSATLSIESTGRGPDLVMLHGWGASAAAWQSLRAMLSAEFTVHAVDLPGHGNAVGGPLRLCRDELLPALADALPPAAWLGWSLGAQVVLELAARYPDRVRAALLMACNPHFVASDGHAGMSPATFRQFRDALERDPGAALTRFSALCATGDGVPRRTLTQWRDALAAAPDPRPDALSDGLDWLAEGSGDALPAVDCPSHFLAAGADRLVPVDAVSQAADHAGGTLCHIDTAPHAAFVGREDVIARWVSDSLTGRRAA
ncbi:MAG: alpha/beta fold hydrolase [Xanthomonadales bacterium]|nr:alpha/beta fold hydrolase [Xanthomonadales bacterium]